MAKDPICCTLCGAAPVDGNLLLCDGLDARGDACPQEWCLDCADLPEVPDGDWLCATCTAGSAPTRLS